VKPVEGKALPGNLRKNRERCGAIGGTGILPADRSRDRAPLLRAGFPVFAYPAIPS